jgi:hypothetical protein
LNDKLRGFYRSTFVDDAGKTQTIEAVLETLDANDMLVDEIESITEDEDA